MAKNILIIDDEIAVASVFSLGLKNAGYEVDIAMDGKNGLDMAGKKQYDLILCDQMMPDLSGNDVLKKLKSNVVTKSVKVSLLTNFGHEELVKEALMLGAENYILKYETLPDQLVMKVRTMIGQP